MNGAHCSKWWSASVHITWLNSPVVTLWTVIPRHCRLAVVFDVALKMHISCHAVRKPPSLCAGVMDPLEYRRGLPSAPFCLLALAFHKQTKRNNGASFIQKITARCTVDLIVQSILLSVKISTLVHCVLGETAFYLMAYCYFHKMVQFSFLITHLKAFASPRLTCMHKSTGRHI